MLLHRLFAPSKQSIYRNRLNNLAGHYAEILAPAAVILSVRRRRTGPYAPWRRRRADRVARAA